MSQTEWIAARYVRSLLSTGLGREQVKAVLLDSGIDPIELDQPGAKVTAEQYSKLLVGLWANSLDECFGFTESPVKRGTFPMMCQTLVSCQNLEHAIRRASRFYNLITDDFCFQLREENTSILFELSLKKPLWGSESFFTESCFAVFLRLSAWLIDQPLVPVEISFAYAQSEGGRSFESKFASPILYDQSRSYLRISRAVLQETIKRDARDLHELLAGGPYAFLIDFRASNSYSGRLKAHMARDISKLIEGLEACARELGTSPSTLRRKLREEGANFHELRDAIRRQRSIYYLQHTHQSIDALASLMGYSEASTFHRAFKKWTGFTPRAFRQQRSPPA